MSFGSAVRKAIGVPVGIPLIGVFLIQFPCAADRILDVEPMKESIEADSGHSVILGDQRDGNGGGVLEDGIVVGDFRLCFFESFFQ